MPNPFHGYCAKGRCKSCGTVLESERPGHFVACPCGHFVDTDRGDHTRHRFHENVEDLRPGPCVCPACSPALTTPHPDGQ